MKKILLIPSLACAGVIATGLNVVSCNSKADTFYLDQLFKLGDSPFGLKADNISGVKDHEYTFILRMADWKKYFPDDEILPWYFDLCMLSNEMWIPVVDGSLQIKIDNHKLNDGEFAIDEGFIIVINQSCKAKLQTCNSIMLSMAFENDFNNGRFTAHYCV